MQHLADVVGADDSVDDAAGGEVLGRLDALRELPAVERGVDAGAEEADQGLGLGCRDLAQRAPARHHPAGGGVPQVDQVGQTRGLVRGDRLGDPDHLDERRGALLHPGAAAHRPGDQGQPLDRGPLDRGDQPVGGGPPDGAGQEPELAQHHRDPAPAQQGLAGDHGLVDATLLGCRGELGGVVLVEVVGADRRGVPADPRRVVEDQLDQVAGARAGHGGRVRAGPGLQRHVRADADPAGPPQHPRLRPCSRALVGHVGRAARGGAVGTVGGELAALGVPGRASRPSPRTRRSCRCWRRACAAGHPTRRR